MAVTNVNNTGMDVNAIMSVKAATDSKKTTQKVQDFSSVLDSASQNSKSGQDESATEVSKNTTRTNDLQDNDVNVDDVGKEAVAVNGDAQDEAVVADEEQPDTELDENVIETVSTALNYIIDQIKEILGVDDDEIAVTMEDLGLSKGDLLDSTNLTQLVTALSGEDSVISLVADEDLYSQLQDLTKVVDTQMETILEDTGLSREELNTVLETIDNVKEPVVETLEALNDVEPVDDEEPVVVVQDNTTKPATTYSKLPENQQETAETTINMQTDKDTKTGRNEQDNQQSKDYSQNQGLSQSQQTTINEKVAEIKSDEATSYITEETTESIMRQLADTVKLVKNDAMTQMELQLHPSSLGTVTVSLVSKGGAVTAQFTTQNEQVKAAIESQAAQLTADIEKQGVKVEAIEVTVESHEMEKNLDDDNRRREKEGEQSEESIKATRRANINLRTLGEDGGDLLEEIGATDDATRIAMELMSAHGNTMDVQA